MILKDRFLTQLAPNTCCTLQKQEFGPNQSLKNCYSWLRRCIMAENTRRKKEPDKGLKPQERLLNLLWNSLRKMPPNDPGEKGWACYYCGKKGCLKWDCPQASKAPPAPCPVCKGPYWKRDCPLRCRPQGSDSQDNQDWRYPGVPNQAPILITPEESWVLIIVESQSVNFLLDTGATFSSLKPLVCFPSHSLLHWGCLDEPNAIISVIC